MACVNMFMRATQYLPQQSSIFFKTEVHLKEKSPHILIF